MARPDRIKVNAPVISAEDRAAVDSVLASGWIGTGPVCASFEAELGEYLGAEHVVCVSSCTAGLELVLDHVGLRPDHRVAVPAWTYPATALPAVHRGAQIVLVDSDPSTLAMDLGSLERALSTGVDLVIPVHLSGIPLPRQLWDLADQHGARVVEDAAHAFGASDELGRLRGVGSLAATFSFHATKNLTCGEGGAVVTADPELAASLHRNRLHGLERDAWERESTGRWRSGDLPEPGRKANLPDVLAAIGRSQLRTFDRRQQHRRELVERYRSHLVDIDGLEMIPGEAHPGSADHMVVVLLPPGADRPDVVGALADHGISTGMHYTPLHQLAWFHANAEVAPGGLEVCDAAAERALTLPLHAGLQLDEVDEVCERLAAAV